MVGHIEPHLKRVCHEDAVLLNRGAKDGFFVSGYSQIDIGLAGPLLGNAKLLYQFCLNALDIQHWRNSMHET